MTITQQEIKLIKSLAQKKFRQKYNKFIAEGDKICSELLERDQYAIHKIYCTNDWYQSHVTDLRDINDLVTICTDRELKKVSLLVTPHKVVMLLTLPTDHHVSPEEDLVLYLDGVQDPGNVGTILRIADWYGIRTIVRSSDSADFFSPKVVQASMASFSNLTLVNKEYTELKEDLLDHMTVGAALGGADLGSYQWHQKSILVMGNEGKGIREEVLTQLDDKIMIPGSKTRVADSLNVAIATSIFCQNWFENKR